MPRGLSTRRQWITYYGNSSLAKAQTATRLPPCLVYRPDLCGDSRSPCGTPQRASAQRYAGSNQFIHAHEHPRAATYTCCHHCSIRHGNSRTDCGPHIYPGACSNRYSHPFINSNDDCETQIHSGSQGHTNARTHIHTQSRTLSHPGANSPIDARAHSYTNTRAYCHNHARAHGYIYARAHGYTYARAYGHTYARAYSYLHARTHGYPDARTHTDTYWIYNREAIGIGIFPRRVITIFHCHTYTVIYGNAAACIHSHAGTSIHGHTYASIYTAAGTRTNNHAHAGTKTHANSIFTLTPTNKTLRLAP